MAPFGVFGAPLDAESRPGSPGDSGLARRGHKKAKNQKKHAELIFYTFVINAQNMIFHKFAKLKK